MVITKTQIETRVCLSDQIGRLPLLAGAVGREVPSAGLQVGMNSGEEFDGIRES